MGKSAKFKNLIKQEADLPALKTYSYKNEVITFREAFKRGIKTVNGVANDGTEKGYVKVTSKVEVPLNHNKKLKEAYNKHGINGVTAYTDSAKQFAEKQNEKDELHK